MQNLRARLEKLETFARPPSCRKIVSWAIQGPVGLPEEAAVAFLRECGHDVRDEDFNLIRVVIGAEDGRPVNLPRKDLTARCEPAVSALHLQRPAGQ